MKNLLKAVFKTGSGTAAVLFLGVVSTKIIAVVLGAWGIGIFSLLRQIRETSISLGTLNGNIALVQGVAVRKNLNERNVYIGTVFWMILLSGITVCCGFIYFAPQLAEVLLKRHDIQAVYLFRWFSLVIFLNALLVFCFGLLNAYCAIGYLALVTVASALTTAYLAYPVALIVAKNKNELAFVGMMSISSTVSLATAIYFLWRGNWFVHLQRAILCGIHLHAVQSFLKIASITFCSGLIATGSLLAIRSLIAREKGIASIGIFDASWTLSMMYINFITKAFSTYYLPTLSGITDSNNRVRLMQKIFRLSTLLMIPMATTIVVLKPFVIHILYSSEFTDSFYIMRWMLIGDYLKITSWVFAVPMLAYTNMRSYLYSEIIWHVFFLFGAYLSVIYLRSLEGIGISFLIAYIFYLIFTIQYCRIRHNFSSTLPVVRHWMMGFVLLLTASLCSWEATKINFVSAFFWIVAACFLSWRGCTKREKNYIKNCSQRLVSYVT
ncbi:MAG: hypothetical protein D3907_00995 [Candidatus Electrothrix sp. AUS3]|nr:hypothetical protein [Candidatus Electrothrix gigas]